MRHIAIAKNMHGYGKFQKENLKNKELNMLLTWSNTRKENYFPRKTTVYSALRKSVMIEIIAVIVFP